MTTTSEIRFCVRYLLEHGINVRNFHEIASTLPSIELDDKFELVKISKANNFFDELAEKLRELWPPGEKDGKYPWRDSVANLSKRLTVLWAQRFPKTTNRNYTIEDCLTVARRYLAQFEDDTKYMQILKYYILKQRSIVQQNGRIKYVTESKFADMLEGKSDVDAIQNEWDFLVNQTSIGEGDLV